MNAYNAFLKYYESLGDKATELWEKRNSRDPRSFSEILTAMIPSSVIIDGMYFKIESFQEDVDGSAVVVKYNGNRWRFII